MEEQRMALIKKYGEKDEKGDISVKEKMQEFMEELNEFLKEEVELSFIPLDLNDVEDLKLSPLDIANLDIFLDEKSVSLLEGEGNV